MQGLRRQAQSPWQRRTGRRSARWRDLVPVRVEVSVVRPGQYDHEAWPTVVMKVLALARLGGDLQHPHGVILKEEAVVCWRGGKLAKNLSTCPRLTWRRISTSPVAL